MTRKKNSGDFLKECMADALFILLRTKSIEEITVSEITALANVSRITYYRNFTSKEKVIEFKLDKLISQWIHEHPRKESASAYESSLSFFQFFYSIHNIVQTLIRANLSVMLLNRLILKFHDFNTPDRNEYYRQIFISFGLCGIILTWMDNGMKESPEQMAETVSRRFFPQPEP
nr:TetR/AcrR family transcriptional regulator C-terminal domain-containing protein [uncultured Blautia sp.]